MLLQGELSQLLLGELLLGLGLSVELRGGGKVVDWLLGGGEVLLLLLLSDAVEEPRGLEPLWQRRGRLLRGELGELAHLGRGRRLLGLEELLLLLLLLLGELLLRLLLVDESLLLLLHQLLLPLNKLLLLL